MACTCSTGLQYAGSHYQRCPEYPAAVARADAIVSRGEDAARTVAAVDAMRAMIAAETASMATLAAATPKVLDGHSDGKRVRYVRHETRAAVLAEVLAILTGGEA